MGEYKRIALCVVIMASVALIVGAATIGILYDDSLALKSDRLQDLVRGQARMIETIARFDLEHSRYPEGARAGTLQQIEAANRALRRKSLGESGALVFGRRDGEHTVIEMDFGASAGESTAPMRALSAFAEPMRRALAGQSGTMVGIDFQGAQVLAAYEPVAIYDLGVVAKIDIAELRAPFVEAAIKVLLTAIVAILIGTMLFIAATEPMIQRITTSENRFRQLFDNMSLAALVYRPTANGEDFTIADMNSAGERRTKMRRNDVVGRRLTAVFPEVERAGVLDLLRKAAHGGSGIVALPAGHYHDQGIDIWFEAQAYRLQSGEVVALFSDLTERRRVELALRDSEMRMRVLLDASQDEILLLSADGRILAINRAARSRLSPRAHTKELIGTAIVSLLPPEVAGAKLAVVERVIATGKWIHFEEEFHDRVFEYWVYPVTAASGNVEEVAIYARDITARRAAEAELSKLYQAIQQSPASVVITDPQGRIEYVNPKFTEVSGYTAAEAMGQNPRILKSGHTATEEYAELWKTISAGGVWHGEFQNKKKNGDEFWEYASIAPVKDVTGRITHFVAVKEDITQRKAIEEQLRQAQRMEAVGQLTGGLAHDFNNLLAIIIGNLQLIERRLKGDETTHGLISDALWSARRGAELVHRLLAFARRQPLNPDEVDMNAVIRGIIGLLQRTFGAEIEIEAKLASDLWSALADRGECERALVNLAVNARDAMAEGGLLTLATRNVVVREGDVEEGSELTPGAYVCLSVEDTGCGMSPEVRARAFEPFFTTKEVGKGSGLGLSMVYGFAKQSGGHARIDSVEGRGTTVSLYFPRAATPTPALPGQAPSGPAPARAGAATPPSFAASAARPPH